MTCVTHFPEQAGGCTDQEAQYPHIPTEHRTLNPADALEMRNMIKTK